MNKSLDFAQILDENDFIPLENIQNASSSEQVKFLFNKVLEMKDLIVDQDRFRDQNLKAVDNLEKELHTVLNEKDKYKNSV